MLSHAWAQALGQPWVVRFEDIDGPRVVAGARERQLEEMRALGLEPAQVLLQTEARPRHWALFREAVAAGQVYSCTCSRKEVLQELASAPHAAGASYTGKCRTVRRTLVEAGREIGWRFKSEDPTRDFLVARTATLAPDEQSFVPAYPWACAIDDADGEYALLVRAWDLAHALDAQRAVQAWVRRADKGWIPPAVFHTALVTGDSGSRLEKRTRGVTLAAWLASGKTAADLATLLRASLPMDEITASALSPGRIWGESRQQATLIALGLSEK